MKVLEMLRSKRVSQRERDAQTFREIVARASEPRTGDEEALVTVMGSLGLTEADVAAYIDALSQIQEVTGIVSQLSERRMELSRAQADRKKAEETAAAAIAKVRERLAIAVEAANKAERDYVAVGGAQTKLSELRNSFPLLFAKSQD